MNQKQIGIIIIIAGLVIAGLSKTTLSLLLQSLEEKGIISRKEKGKTKEVFLRKVF